jgi:hypothetical protein
MLNNILRDLEGSKGGGNDSVTNKLLKLVADSIDRPLCLLFRKIVQTELFPIVGNWAQLSISIKIKEPNLQLIIDR